MLTTHGLTVSVGIVCFILGILVSQIYMNSQDKRTINRKNKIIKRQAKRLQQYKQLLAHERAERKTK